MCAAAEQTLRRTVRSEVADRFSLVEVPESAVTDVIAALRASTIKGKKATVRRERGGAR
ncbi:hypothetical protein HC031_09770 [Planosporangium thailandense]|uniref:DEAD box helicase DbpA/CsdA RNA-binding domain-containing protein n=1 Tax=Planosporangium thailandense TaxID=765197 RepID=A0ABX0XXN1_9ACTN|nr:hypothetical protein [Planosporangium thailandense]